MRKMKKYLAALLILCMVIGLAGCSRVSSVFRKSVLSDNTDDLDNGYSIYYISQDETEIKAFPYQLTSATEEGIIEECIKALKAKPDDENYKSVFDDSLVLLKYKYDKETSKLKLYFDSSFEKMSDTTQMLVRAALVKTMTQFVGLIDGVYIKVADQWISDENGDPLAMKDSDYVEEITTNMEYLDDADLTLYFANEDGTDFEIVRTTMKYYTTSSVASVVLDALIRGPGSQDGCAVLSPQTRVRSIYIKGGLCQVDFNSEFLEKVDGRSLLFNIYSVVNSLTELDGINKVQITVNGDDLSDVQDDEDLAGELTHNEKIFESEE